jgi:hypothetical protein
VPRWSKILIRPIIGRMQPVIQLSSFRAPVVLFALAAVSLSLFAKDFVKPVAHSAKTYRAHDEHPSEKVSIGADPYDTAEKAKAFSVNFQEHGFLPIFFVVTNDGDQPISIANMEVTFTTANRSKITPSSSEDIFRRISNPRTTTNQLPLPIPQKKVKGGVSQKERDEIESSQFAARAVEPHTTQSGFFFFDVGDIPSPLAGAHVYITGVNDAKGTELMYFEIAMEN